jgi:chaperonin cofactor prefoldin
MRPPQHRVDATLRAMEKAHRASSGEQVEQFSRSVGEAKRAFERFEASEEAEPLPPQGGSLLSLVQSERSVEDQMDKALEDVKERLADMERKRMLALGALSRLSEPDALEELKRLKEHVLGLALRVPLRADFIVHGQNVGLSLFKLYEATELAEREVAAIIAAKEALDKGQGEG